ncbi:MAG: hypothetical protein JWN20_2673 [Jatrophihabitantaceae bacterium]|nr:hypothetical protein [Jatrophihabitantaceae bacterium]
MQHVPEKLPPAPPDPAASITVGGERIACPRGTEPEFVISAATFDPLPRNGSQFDPGTYTISLGGSVLNDTSGSIDIKALEPMVNGSAWAASVSGPATVAAGEAESVTISGTLVVQSVLDQPSFGADMQWQWSDATLRPCGAEGLLSEH